MTGEVFLIAGLLTNEHDLGRPNPALTENCLSRCFVQIAPHTTVGRRFQGGVVNFVRKEIECTSLRYRWHTFNLGE
jgi:hypothetical protein